MENFNNYLASIDDIEHREFMEEILSWVHKEFPMLETTIKWNQPMFIKNGTYIIGFSHSKNHVAMSPEVKPIQVFKNLIEAAELSHTNNIVRVRWEDPIPYELMRVLIEYNIEDKTGYHKFWR